MIVRWARRLLPALLWIAACGDDEFVGPYGLVGGPCGDAFDCAPGLDCERGGDFPQGTCTLPCRGHYDCPVGTACADVAGGVCLVACSTKFDCRVGYDCKAKRSRGGGGESLVCVK